MTTATPNTATSAQPEPTAGRMQVLARQGLSLPRNITTTYHLGAAYPFAVEAGLGHRGILMGVNRLSGGGVRFEQVEEEPAAAGETVEAHERAFDAEAGFDGEGVGGAEVVGGGDVAGQA